MLICEEAICLCGECTVRGLAHAQVGAHLTIASSVQMALCKDMEIAGYPTVMMGYSEQFISAHESGPRDSGLHMAPAENRKSAKAIIQDVIDYFGIPPVAIPDFESPSPSPPDAELHAAGNLTHSQMGSDTHIAAQAPLQATADALPQIDAAQQSPPAVVAEGAPAQAQVQQGSQNVAAATSPSPPPQDAPLSPQVNSPDTSPPPEPALPERRADASLERQNAKRWDASALLNAKQNPAQQQPQPTVRPTAADPRDITSATVQTYREMLEADAQLPAQRAPFVRFWTLAAQAHPVPACRAGAATLVAGLSAWWPPRAGEHWQPPEAMLSHAVCGSVAGGEGGGAEPAYHSCRGSRADSRGYTCGLWMLLHSLSVGCATTRVAIH